VLAVLLTSQSGWVLVVLIASQVLLGRRLSEPTRGDRLYLRRWHFWSMIGIVVLGLGHVALDGPLAVLLVR